MGILGSGRNIFLIVFIATLAVGLLLIVLIFNVAFRSPDEPILALPSVTITPSPSTYNTNSVPAITISPSPEPIFSAIPTPDVLNYIVQAGDTLSDISFRFFTTVDELKRLNGLQGDTIFPNQSLIISLPPGETPAIQSPTITNQSTPIEENGVHIVAPDETLVEIASHYDVTIENIRIANAMIGNAILVGQHLTIPVTQILTPQPWNFSIIEGNLDHAYPLVIDNERFTLHYTPETYPAQDPEILAQLIQRGLEHIEMVMSAQLPDLFDVYTAGSVFAPPNRSLRGRTFSYRWETFFLHDGTGNEADQLYIATHELTHLFAWNVFGQPVSIMLSEGAAVYTGMKAIANSHHIPLEQFCLAYLRAGQLPVISTSLNYQGHNLDLENYYTAGCFVGYLIETYGPYSFGQLYSTEDYQGIYGRSLPDIEKEWRENLASPDDLEVPDPSELTTLVDDVTSSYASFFPSFTGTTIQIDAYRELDNARIALLEGRFEDARQSLTSFREYLRGR